eukprot:175853_1
MSLSLFFCVAIMGLTCSMNINWINDKDLSMLSGRSAAAHCLMNDAIYIFGGLMRYQTSNTDSNTIYVLPISNSNPTWTLSTITTPIKWWMQDYFVCVDNRLYVFAPKSYSSNPVNRPYIYQFDAVGHQWYRAQSLSSAINSPCAALEEQSGNVYLTGKYSSDSTVFLQIYSTKMNKWITPQYIKAPKVVADAQTCQCYKNETCYFFGGSYNGKSNIIQQYDIANNEWEILDATTTFNTIESTSILYEGYIYIIGGRCDGKACGTNIFDVKRKSVIIPNGTLYHNVSDSAVIVYDDKMYVIGGAVYSETSGIVTFVEYAKIPNTKSPTNVPTNSPTNAPTNSPTNAPTHFPSDSPTDYPTKSPTKTSNSKNEFMIYIIFGSCAGLIVCVVVSIICLIRSGCRKGNNQEQIDGLIQAEYAEGKNIVVTD